MSDVGLQDAPSEADVWHDLYLDLLYQVQTKHPGETRHETAKRYLRERESSSSVASATKQASESEES